VRAGRLLSVDAEAEEEVLLARLAAHSLVSWTHGLQAADKVVERALELTRGALHSLAAAHQRRTIEPQLLCGMGETGLLLFVLRELRDAAVRLEASVGPTRKEPLFYSSQLN
jgi:hypothetical protein